jgi:hypothetical protein
MRRRTERIYEDHLLVDEVEIDEWEAPWTDTDTVDAAGRQLAPGQYVVRAIPGGRAVNIEIRRVREIKDGRVYLNTSKTPIIYPCRVLIVDNWPPGAVGAAPEDAVI